ncbi:helix-turn-helix domain-containing protein [Streptomyces chrestomyceticus]|uniref:helix-turn-helix domain-containing protein n=1 Tax=Streptomyces chrestomyceticus TaxID=68185 RepID=UPI00369FE622
MVNERLRRAMHRAGLDIASLADASEVSTKTVERWLSGKVPYPRTRYRVAAIVQEDESYLWPEAVNGSSLAGAEMVATYPRRSDVPRHLWMELLRSSERDIDLLAFAGLFLTEEHPDWLPTLAEKAREGHASGFSWAIRPVPNSPQGIASTVSVAAYQGESAPY